MPWVLIDGVHNQTAEDEIIDDAIKFVCQRIDEDQRPPSCRGADVVRSEDSIPAVRPELLGFFSFPSFMCFFRFASRFCFVFSSCRVSLSHQVLRVLSTVQ